MVEVHYTSRVSRGRRVRVFKRIVGLVLNVFVFDKRKLGLDHLGDLLADGGDVAESYTQSGGGHRKSRAPGRVDLAAIQGEHSTSDRGDIDTQYVRAYDRRRGRGFAIRRIVWRQVDFGFLASFYIRDAAVHRNFAKNAWCAL